MTAQPQTLCEQDHWVQSFCVNLHNIGIWVHQPTRQLFEDAATSWADGLLNGHDFVGSDIAKEAKAAKVAKRPARKAEPGIKVRAAKYGLRNYNPNSSQQTSELLYNKFGLEPDPHEMTKAAAYGTGAPVLRRMILEDQKLGLDEEQVDLLYMIFRYRKIVSKYLGTYLKPFGVTGSHVWGDGRVRSNWAGHVVITRRLSSSDPNHQNLPLLMKYIYQPERDEFDNFIHGYAGADMEQMHPRIFAILWEIERLQEAFLRGEDCYSHVADMLFPVHRKHLYGFCWRDVCPKKSDGSPDWTVKPKKGTAAGKMRDRAKTHLLASAYGAMAETRLRVLRKAEDEYGNLAMRDLDRQGIELMDEDMHKGMPELERGWRREVEMARLNGVTTGTDPWLADPIGGAIRYFHNGTSRDVPGSDFNDIANFRTLTAEAAIMHARVQELEREFPLYYEGPGTGIFIQVHDQAGIEMSIRSLSAAAAEKKMQDTAKKVRDIMGAFTWRGVRFPAEESYGFDLSCA